MTTISEEFSVADAASLCGVSHGTVGYWIRENKLRAKRHGWKYSIPSEELVFFLRTNGMEVPQSLTKQHSLGPVFRAPRTCWDYWGKTPHGDSCKNCVVAKNNSSPCFAAKQSCSLGCSSLCGDCGYYVEECLPTVSLVHQFANPAAVAVNFHLWGANEAFSALVNISERKIPGVGLEQLLSPESLGKAITHFKRLSIEAEHAPICEKMSFNQNGSGNRETTVRLLPLEKPIGGVLILLEH